MQARQVEIYAAALGTTLVLAVRYRSTVVVSRRCANGHLESQLLFRHQLSATIRSGRCVAGTLKRMPQKSDRTVLVSALSLNGPGQFSKLIYFSKVNNFITSKVPWSPYKSLIHELQSMARGASVESSMTNGASDQAVESGVGTFPPPARLTCPH